MILEMLQGFFKKSFSMVSWPVLRSSSAIRRAWRAIPRASGGASGDSVDICAQFHRW
jgi:hypothetical protein